MKNLLLIFALFACTSAAIAQGNSKNKDKGKDKNHHSSGKSEQGKHDDDGVWDQPSGNNNGGKASKNQPKKVQSALLRDYPNAGNVTWTKYKGDYTATFNNGPWRSTAVYHANGERRDTRTPLTRQQLPGSIWDIIFKRDKIKPTKYVQIERPSAPEPIFRVVAADNTAHYYTPKGVRVQYDY